MRCSCSLLLRILLWAVLPFITLVISVSAQDDNYLIKGRVVSSKGQPVGNADICFEPVVRSSEYDGFIGCVGSAGDGTFEIEKSKNEFNKSRKYELYVYFGTSKDRLGTIEPPYYGLQRYDAKFHGLSFVLGRARVLNVGDVPVQFWYGQVDLDLSRTKAATHRPTIDWDRLVLQIRTAAGKLIYSSTLSHNDVYVESFIDRNRGVLKVSLPEGAWKVEVLWNDKVRGTNNRVNVARGHLTNVILYPASASRKRSN
jgi:hypothetical protein